MPHCLTSKSPSSTPPSTGTSIATFTSSSDQNGNSRAETPRSSVQPSPNVNFSREYTLAIQTESYNEIRSKIQEYKDDDPQAQLLLSQVLQPNRECVQEALCHARPSTLTDIVSAYFNHSEKTSHLCLVLHHSIHRAHALYAPLNDLLEILPSDFHALNESQCTWAYDIFLQFDSHENPFPCPDSHNFQDMRQCFSELRQQLDQRLRKSQSRVRMMRRVTVGSAFCLIGTAVCVTVSAIVIAAHALVVIVASPLFATCFPRNFSKKELAHLIQLDAAKKGIYVLNNELDTIDRLVDSLYTATEGHKLLVRIGLERGQDRHPIYEVVKQLRKDHLNFTEKLQALEEHIYLCFSTVNRARSSLLREILVHQNM